MKNPTWALQVHNENHSKMKQKRITCFRRFCLEEPLAISETLPDENCLVRTAPSIVARVENKHDARKDA